tara:strand:+ start:414 stop:551 length:138 start_codon:yes stop_codon:yes gene_type:complete
MWLKKPGDGAVSKHYEAALRRVSQRIVTFDQNFCNLPLVVYPMSD